MTRPSDASDAADVFDAAAAGQDGLARVLADDPGRFRVVQTPAMRQGLGPEGLAELAEAAPPDRSVRPRLPVPEGWVELAVAGAHQTLLMSRSARRRGVLAQVRVQHTERGGDGAEVPEVSPGPGSLVLAVERWSAGGWTGVHSAWLQAVPGGTTLHRSWELPTAHGGRVDIGTQYTVAQALHLDHRVDALVAALEVPDAGPVPADFHGAEALFQDRMARRQVPSGLPDSLLLQPGGLDWLAGAAGVDGRAGRLQLESPAIPGDVLAAGLAASDGVPSEGAQRMHSVLAAPQAAWGLYRVLRDGAELTARFWQGERTVLAAAPAEGGLHVGLYPGSDAAGLVLRMTGLVAEGPHAAPTLDLTWDQLTGPVESPASEAGRGTGVPEQWWLAPRRYWQLVPLARDGGPALPAVGTGGAAPSALQIVSVQGFGHYVLGPSPSGRPGAFRLHEVSGLALLQAVRAHLRTGSTTN